MKILNKVQAIISNSFFSQYRTVLGLWLLLALIAWLTKYFPGSYNNFLIFKNVFWHTMHESPLYIPYPNEYLDVNLYGPFFSIVIAPFAITPLWMGLLTWLLASAGFLFYATRKFPVSQKKQIFIYWFCAHELLTGLFMSQFNIAIAAIIILAFVYIEKEKDEWAAFMIILGTFVKLYGIVGFAFFFFSKHKIKFILSCAGWSIVMFVAPMLIASPEYVLSQYVDWFTSLTAKNSSNTFSLMQNISFLGMVRKISGNPFYSDLYLIVPGILLFAIPYLRISQYKNSAFRQTLLASVLLFTVLFSTGSESSTYIIAFMGVAIWYVAAPWKRSGMDTGLLIFAFILTSLSPSDIFPKYVREHLVRPYALKALPCMLIWLKLSFEMYTQNYGTSLTAKSTKDE